MTNKFTIKDIEIRKYAIPINDIVSKAKIIPIHVDHHYEHFIAHQIDEMREVGKKVISVPLETMIVGALENYHHEKIKPSNGYFIFEIKDKKFSKEVYSELEKKAKKDYQLKGKVTFW